MWSKFKTFEIWLFLLPLFLAVGGVVMIYSITLTTLGTSLAIKQLISLSIGLIFYFIFSFFDYRAIKTWSWLIYLLAIASLVLVRLIGTSSFGAKRWIELGFFQFQPSELAKLALICLLATVFADRIRRLHSRRLLMVSAMVLLPVILVMQEPDLGSALTIGLIGFIMTAHAGLSKRQWLVIVTILIAVAAVVLMAWYKIGPFADLIKNYQRARIETFINPAADPSGAGYNVLQAVIAVGSGGVTGRGLGFGSQSQLNFLPVSHTDFIFASIAESWGFVGSAFILFIYGLLITKILTAARLAQDDFSMLFCVGVAALFIVQVVVNVGMNIQLLPVTGITLPLMSYGGSSLLTNLILLGIVQSVVVRYKRISFN